jgi:CDP-diglyceride synthetase
LTGDKTLLKRKRLIYCLVAITVVIFCEGIGYLFNIDILKIVNITKSSFNVDWQSLILCAFIYWYIVSYIGWIISHDKDIIHGLIVITTIVFYEIIGYLFKISFLVIITITKTSGSLSLVGVVICILTVLLIELVRMRFAKFPTDNYKFKL